MGGQDEWWVPLCMLGFFVIVGAIVLAVVPPAIYVISHYVGPPVDWWLRLWLT